MISLRSVATLLLALTSLHRVSARPSEAASLEREKRLDLILRTEITIDRPVKEVWPHFLNMEAWMVGHRFQPIEGQPGEEGQIRLVMPEGEKPENYYFIETVRATPFAQYVVKVVPRTRDNFAGFADFSFTEIDGKTHLIYDIYVDRPAPPMSDKELRKLRDEQHANSREFIASNNRNLKALVEGKWLSGTAAATDAASPSPAAAASRNSYNFLRSSRISLASTPFHSWHAPTMSRTPTMAIG